MGKLEFFAQDYRAAERKIVYLRITAVDGFGNRIPLVIVDVSEGGMMARTDARLSEGDAILASLPAIGDRRAEVRWALGGRIGCAFDHPMDDREYRALLSAIALAH